VTGHAKARNLPNGRLSLLDVKTGSIAFDRLAYLIAILETLPEAVAVGTLASALAHELNQPLKAVANYVSAGRDLLDDEPPSNRVAIREAPDEAAIEAMEHVSTKQLMTRASAECRTGGNIGCGQWLRRRAGIARKSVSTLHQQ
jgi:signal transduction histidine kinase